MLDGKKVASLDFAENQRKSLVKGNKFYANKLVEICKHFGFDGYLINIEVKTDGSETLLEWL